MSVGASQQFTLAGAPGSATATQDGKKKKDQHDAGVRVCQKKKKKMRIEGGHGGRDDVHGVEPPPCGLPRLRLRGRHCGPDRRHVPPPSSSPRRRRRTGEGLAGLLSVGVGVGVCVLTRGHRPPVTWLASLCAPGIGLGPLLNKALLNDAIAIHSNGGLLVPLIENFSGNSRKENREWGDGEGELYHEGGSRSGERMQESPSSSSSLFIILADKHALAFSAAQHRGRTPAVPRTRDVLVRSVPRFSFSSTIWRGIPCHLRRRMARTRRPWPRQPTARPKRGPRRRHASRPGHPRSPIVWCVQQRGKVRWMGGEATRRWVPDDEP